MPTWTAEYTTAIKREEQERFALAKRAIHTDTGPVQGSPYSPAVRVDNTIFISGQIPIDPATGLVVQGDFATQVRQCLRNLAAVLKQEGLGLDSVVKTTVFLTDLQNFQELNRIYGPYFTGVKPARSTIQVSRLPLDVAVEIEAIAIAGQ